MQPIEISLPVSRPQLPTLVVQRQWQQVLLKSELRAKLAAILPGYLQTCRWFNAQGRILQSLQITEFVPIPYRDTQAFLVLLQVEYTEGLPESYTLPIAYTPAGTALADSPEELRLSLHPGMTSARSPLLAQVKVEELNQTGMLFEAVADKDFLLALLATILGKQDHEGIGGRLSATLTAAETLPDDLELTCSRLSMAIPWWSTGSNCC